MIQPWLLLITTLSNRQIIDVSGNYQLILLPAISELWNNGNIWYMEKITLYGDDAGNMHSGIGQYLCGRVTQRILVSVTW